MSEQTRYPLAWPQGWARIKPYQRERATFRSSKKSSFTDSNGMRVESSSSKPLTVADAIKRLSGELSRLGATNEILSTNVKTRLDGLPYSNQPEPDDVGAAAYFKLKGKPRCLACDKWNRVADNIAAIAQHIDALRRIDRYGVGTMEQAFAGYAALPPSFEDWRTVFGLSQSATLAEVETKFRALAIEHHPDRGGDPAVMSKLNAARDAAKRELT